MPLGAARRAGPWRAASGRLKERAPATWERLAAVWSWLETKLEPLEPVWDYPASLWVGLRNREHFMSVLTFVLFVGYPRSGHTVLASLLNAHPNVVIGHRLRALRCVETGYSGSQIRGMVLAADRRFAAMGRIGSKRYDYSVPGQWQGRFAELQVIGDGNVSNSILRRRPDLLPKLRARVGVPVRLIHVVRNPYDNIATLSIRNRLTIDEAIDRYFELCEGSMSARAACEGDDWIDVRHEDLLDDPEGCLRRLCGILGIKADDGYLRDCGSIVYRRPHRSRLDVAWSPAQLSDIQARMDGYPFLEGYSFDEGSTYEEGSPAGST